MPTVIHVRFIRLKLADNQVKLFTELSTSVGFGILGKGFVMGSIVDVGPQGSRQ